MGTNARDSSSLERSTGAGHVSCQRDTDFVSFLMSLAAVSTILTFSALESVCAWESERTHPVWLMPECCDVSFTIAVGKNNNNVIHFLSATLYTFLCPDVSVGNLFRRTLCI